MAFSGSASRACVKRLRAAWKLPTLNSWFPNAFNSSTVIVIVKKCATRSTFGVGVI